jgi:hypothetical protein
MNNQSCIIPDIFSSKHTELVHFIDSITQNDLEAIILLDSVSRYINAQITRKFSNEANLKDFQRGFK